MNVFGLPLITPSEIANVQTKKIPTRVAMNECARSSGIAITSNATINADAIFQITNRNFRRGDE